MMDYNDLYNRLCAGESVDILAEELTTALNEAQKRYEAEKKYDTEKQKDARLLADHINAFFQNYLPEGNKYAELTAKDILDILDIVSNVGDIVATLSKSAETVKEKAKPEITKITSFDVDKDAIKTIRKFLDKLQ